ncbi:MAG: B12-binding domain-containing radical SAM protein [Desulfobacterales bacterium]|nr:MAG: B12-binding domain-containing radical SAM protein [Desulfobacterales bacterium]
MRSLPELKKLPFKDYTIFDFQKIIDAKNGWVGLMASRGCPFACSYCFNHQVVKHYRRDLKCSFKELNYIRHFSVPQILDEIQYLLRNYRNIKMFIFDDDLFTFYKDYVKEFCRRYPQVSSLPFVVNAHVGFFDEDRARYLANANCQIVKFGVESGSHRIRQQIMRRHMTNEKIMAAIRTAKQFGLHTSVFLMIGLPDETREDVLATVQLMSQAQPGRYRWSFFYPFPDTEAYAIADKRGYIDPAKMQNLKNFTASSGLDFGAEHNLFLQKVGKIMPWLVNAYSDLEVADFYRRKVEEILALDEPAWKQLAPKIYAEDQRISENFVRQGLRHYAIKYNPFMGVISDYFTTET